MSEKGELARIPYLRFCLFCPVHFSLTLPFWKTKWCSKFFPSQTGHAVYGWPWTTWMSSVKEGKVEYCLVFQSWRKREIRTGQIRWKPVQYLYLGQISPSGSGCLIHCTQFYLALLDEGRLYVTGVGLVDLLTCTRSYKASVHQILLCKKKL